MNKLLGLQVRYFVKLTSFTRDNILNYFVGITPFYDIQRQLRCYFYNESYCTVFKESFLYDNFVKDSQYVNLFNIKSKPFTQRVILKLDNP